MQPARDHPLFLCWFWMCISTIDWNKSVPQFLGVWPWPLTFTDHLRSKLFSPFESLYMTSYLTSIDNFSLSHTVFEIFDFKVFKVWPWPLEVTWGQKFFQHSKAQTWNYYLSSIDFHSPSPSPLPLPSPSPPSPLPSPPTSPPHPPLPQQYRKNIKG